MSVYRKPSNKLHQERRSQYVPRNGRAKMLLSAIDAIENNPNLTIEQKRRGTFPLRRALLRSLDDDRAI